MTKRRAPMSLQQALLDAVDIIGWPEACQVTNKKERTLRDLTDPDLPRQLGMADALALDAACMRANGDVPFAYWYLTQLELALNVALLDRAGRAERAAEAAKEAGEAIGAQINALATGDPGDEAIARRETEQAISALGRTLPDLGGGRLDVGARA